jgi:hypothetical protein
MVNDSLKVTGQVTIVVTDKTGAVKDTRNIKNLVVTTGKEFIAAALASTQTYMTHMAIGSDSTNPVVGNTTLGAELGRTALTSTTVNGATVTYNASFTAGVGTGAVTEAGIFNDSTTGTLLCRTTFAVVNKGADDSVSITWQVTVQ